MAVTRATTPSRTGETTNQDSQPAASKNNKNAKNNVDKDMGSSYYLTTIVLSADKPAATAERARDSNAIFPVFKPFWKALNTSRAPAVNTTAKICQNVWNALISKSFVDVFIYAPTMVPSNLVMLNSQDLLNLL